jgi:hypothetical protein
MAALWIAADLAGQVPLPPADAMRRDITAQLAFMDTATDRHHCHGTKIIPFSMHNVDEVLGDLDLNISARVRASHWINPIDPAAYRGVTPALLKRLSTSGAPAESPGTPPLVAAAQDGPSPAQASHRTADKQPRTVVAHHRTAD